MTRPLYEIAREIRLDIESGNWSRRASYFAAPYLSAMRDLGSIEDKYINDDAKAIVLYFLSNASTWRGDTARRIKAELKAMAK